MLLLLGTNTAGRGLGHVSTQGASALAGAPVHLTSHGQPSSGGWMGLPHSWLSQPLMKYFQDRSLHLELLLRLVGLFQLKSPAALLPSRYVSSTCYYTGAKTQSSQFFHLAPILVRGCLGFKECIQNTWGRGKKTLLLLWTCLVLFCLSFGEARGLSLFGWCWLSLHFCWFAL